MGVVGAHSSSEDVLSACLHAYLHSCQRRHHHHHHHHHHPVFSSTESVPNILTHTALRDGQAAGVAGPFQDLMDKVARAPWSYAEPSCVNMALLNIS